MSACAWKVLPCQGACAKEQGTGREGPVYWEHDPQMASDMDRLFLTFQLRQALLILLGAQGARPNLKNQCSNTHFASMKLHIDAFCKCCPRPWSGHHQICWHVLVHQHLGRCMMMHGCLSCQRWDMESHIETDDFTSRMYSGLAAMTQTNWHKPIELASPKVWHLRPPMTSPNLDLPRHQLT